MNEKDFDIVEFDEEIAAILQKKRRVAIQTAAATKKLQERNKMENLETRLRYARIERERKIAYNKNMAENTKKHASMYDNSPFQLNVGANYLRIKARKEKEAAFEREHKKIYKILENMHGTPKVDVVKLAPKDVLEKVLADPFNKIELERRRSRVDSEELRKELSFLEKMVEDCIIDTRKKFPVIDQITGNRVEDKHALLPHSAKTLFIRNDQTARDRGLIAAATAMK